MLEVTASDGSSFRCTENHPIWVENKGYISAVDVLQLTHAEAPVYLRNLCQAVPQKPEVRGEVQEAILLQEMQGSRANGREEPNVGRWDGHGSLSLLQEGIQEQGGGICTPSLLLQGMQEIAGNRKQKNELRKMRNIIRSSMGIESSILLKRLFKQGASHADAWHREWPLYKRSMAYPARTRVHESTQEFNPRARRLEVRSLRSTGDRENTSRSSYRWRENGSPTGKSSEPLRLMPSCGARRNQPRLDGEIRLHSIKRCEQTDFVYNLRVGGSHDYYVSRLLSHNCDDPNNTEEIESEPMRQGVLDWWDHTMSTRGNNPKTVARVIVQQRLHEQDLTGHVLEQGGYTHLMLPMRFEKDRRCVTFFGGKTWQDPRGKEGEFLWPERFSETEIAELEKRLGSYMAAGQLQQRPSPAGGGMLKTHWQPRGANMDPVAVKMPDGTVAQVHAIESPDKFDVVIQSWDCAFKDEKTSDFVVGGVLAAKGANRFLLDLVRDRMDLAKTILAVRQLSARYPMAHTKLVEDRANGPAVMQSLHNKVGGFVAVNPIGGKLSRAAAASPMLESGNWYLPHPQLAPWVDGFIGECSGFPKAQYDDQVDMWSQGAARLLNVVAIEDDDDATRLRIQSRKDAGWTA